jgi:hypothetical protein
MGVTTYSNTHFCIEPTRLISFMVKPFICLPKYSTYIDHSYALRNQKLEF